MTARRVSSPLDARGTLSCDTRKGQALGGGGPLRPCPLAGAAWGCGFSLVQGVPFTQEPALKDLSQAWRTCWCQGSAYAQSGKQVLGFQAYL